MKGKDIEKIANDSPSETVIDKSAKLTDLSLEEIIPKAEKRLISLTFAYEQFIKKAHIAAVEKEFYLNKELLMLAIKSYFKDIYSYKLNSKTGLANEEKKCAYMIKWISKVKPIQIKSDVENISELTIYINSLFAVFAGFIHINLSNIRGMLSTEFFDELFHKVHSENMHSNELVLLIRALIKRKDDYVNKK